MNQSRFRPVKSLKMTVRTSVLWKMNIHMGKKWPEMVVQRSSIKGHSFPYRLYHKDRHWITISLRSPLLFQVLHTYLHTWIYFCLPCEQYIFVSVMALLAHNFEYLLLFSTSKRCWKKSKQIFKIQNSTSPNRWATKDISVILEEVVIQGQPMK